MNEPSSTTAMVDSHVAEPTLPDVQMHLVKPREPVTGVLTKSEICTSPKAASFVRHIEIDVSGTPLAGGFVAGQSFGVIPPGEDAKGKPHKVRLYSIAAPTCGEDGQGAVLSTTVKRTIDEHWSDHTLFLGVASNYLCDLKVGDKVRLSGPNGKRFILPADPAAHDYLFLATGTGVAPFRGMALDLLRSGCPSRVTLVMGAPYATDLLYHDFFTNLDSEHENFTYLTALSRQPQLDGAEPMYVQGRLATDRDGLARMLEEERTLLYICGLSGMELGVFQTMARMLKGESLSQYLTCDAEALRDVDGWKRSMIRKQIKPTHRVFVEVY